MRPMVVLLLALASVGLGAQQVTAPAAVPEQAFYHPDAPGLFESRDDFLAWYRGRPAAAHAYDPSKLTLGIYFHIALYQAHNHANIDALVRAIERRGANVIVLAGHASPALSVAFVRDGRSIIDALLFSGERLNVSDRDAGLAEARRLDVPILEALNHYGMTAAQFAASPTGLHPELTSILVDAERDGLIEPIVVSGKGALQGEGRLNEPFPLQIEWRVDRALAWARLHRAANASKRVVFTYWSEGAGKANVGGDPDDFLDVQGSLVRLLGELKAHGYDVGTAPLPARDTLAQRMALEASNVGNWAPAEIARRVRNHDVALIPEATYRRWFDALPQPRRDEIVEMWGPPPGNVMVYTDPAGKRFLVIPRIEFGNVLIAPHPDWGYLQNAKALTSVGALPPHHQYVAFFLWLQHEWRADAWVPLFSNLVLEPGKSEGPAADDHVAILLGALPNIHPERLGANGGPGDKRKAMAQTVGWYNLVAPSDAVESLGGLRAAIARYQAQPDQTLRAGAEATIRQEVARTGVDRALAFDSSSVAFPQLIRQVTSYVDELERAHSPYGSKVLGDAPAGRVLSDMVAGMLGPDLRAALQPVVPDPELTARAVVAAVILDGRTPQEAIVAQVGRSLPEAQVLLARAGEYADRLRAAPREIGGILDALSGHWIEPGPMDEPMHRPDAVPPGRSLYNFDQAAIPTPEAEAIGVAQAEAMIAAHRETHGGAYPTQLAFVVWSADVAKTNGVTEAEILHLLGTRAIRNARGEVTGVELIPRETLGRPRVDVLASISGVYRDHYLDKVELITEAVRLASASPEDDNPVAAATRATETKLRAAGTNRELAATLARARVFGEAPGAYSPGIQFLAKSGDQRGDATRMSELYTSRMSHAYGAGLYGIGGRTAFEANLSRIDSATLPRTGNVNGLLDDPSPAAFLGGLNLAAHTLTGHDIDLFVSNLQDLSHASTEPAAQSLQTELRTRYFNPSWLKEMKTHGYDGARNMMFLTDQLDLWDSTATRMVSSDDWAQVKSVYVDDSLGLGLDAFFDRYNPFAQQVLLANLLGAASRGQWSGSPSDLAEVAARLARSAAQHGAVCEAALCRNPALTALVDRALMAAPGGAALAAGYRAAIADVTGKAPGAGRAPASTTTGRAAPGVATAPGAPLVTGRVLDEISPSPSASHASTDVSLLLLAGIGLMLAVIGWFGPKDTKFLSS